MHIKNGHITCELHVWTSSISVILTGKCQLTPIHLLVAKNSRNRLKHTGRGYGWKKSAVAACRWRSRSSAEKVSENLKKPSERHRDSPWQTFGLLRISRCQTLLWAEITVDTTLRQPASILPRYLFPQRIRQPARRCFTPYRSNWRVDNTIDIFVWLPIRKSFIVSKTLGKQRGHLISDEDLHLSLPIYYFAHIWLKTKSQRNHGE